MATIPVIVDDVKFQPGFAVTRCRYYAIACDIPAPAWVQFPERARLPFLLVGLSGIIYKPLGQKRLFNTSDRIEALFDAVDSDPEMYIDSNDIWLPNLLFERAGEANPRRGQVWRISTSLFTLADQARRERLTIEKLEEACTTLEGDALRFSPSETRGFRAWGQAQIAKASRIYHSDLSKNLKRPPPEPTAGPEA